MLGSIFSNGGLARLMGHLRPIAARTAGATLDVLFPPRCACCDAELLPDHNGLLLCDGCQAMLGPEIWNGCRRCGAMMDAKGQSSEGCPLCREMRLRTDSVVPLGSYEGRLREAVLKTKRPAHEPLAMALGRLLAARRGPQLAEFRPDFIVPIPMHWWRRMGRGVNSPESTARCLGRQLGIPVDGRLLVRRRNTMPQKDLLPRQRFRNVRGAFHLHAGRGVRCRGSHVLLVDDILTTGATCSEAARVLKQAGAALVVAAVLAKAQGK